MPRPRWETLLRDGRPLPPLLVSGNTDGDGVNAGGRRACCAPAPFSHTSGDAVAHHELLRQFVLDEVQALWAQRDGHGAPARLNGFSGEQAVDLVKDLLQLGAWVRQRSSELTDTAVAQAIFHHCSEHRRNLSTPAVWSSAGSESKAKILRQKNKRQSDTSGGGFPVIVFVGQVLCHPQPRTGYS